MLRPHVCASLVRPPPVEVFGPQPAPAFLQSVPRTMAEYSYVKSTKLVLKGTKAKR